MPIEKPSQKARATLRLVKFINLPAIASDPRAFYKTRAELYVAPAFTSQVLALAKPARLGPATLRACDLTDGLYDKDIKTELRGDPIFGDPVELAVRIEQILTRQSYGENLLSDRGENLAYSPGGVVRIGWFATGQWWYVNACEFDGGRWPEYTRVLSPIQ